MTAPTIPPIWPVLSWPVSPEFDKLEPGVEVNVALVEGEPVEVSPGDVMSLLVVKGTEDDAVSVALVSEREELVGTEGEVGFEVEAKMGIEPNTAIPTLVTEACK